MRSRSLLRRVVERFGYYPVNMKGQPGTGFLLPIQLKILLEELRINCVLDVGANTGQYAQMLRGFGFRGHILSFEPVLSAFATLELTAQTDSSWRVFNYALGSEAGKSKINRGSKDYVSSFLTPTDSLQAIVPTEFTPTEVSIETIDGVLDGLLKNIPAPRLFLKTDTQGFDLEVLKGARESIGRFMGLQAELSVRRTYENAPSYLESLRTYEQSGFTLRNLYSTVVDSDETVIEFDCLMIRKPR